MVRTILYALLGATVGGASLIAAGYMLNAVVVSLDIRLYQSEADMERNVYVFVGLFALSVLAGAWAGLKWAHRDAA